MPRKKMEFSPVPTQWIGPIKVEINNKLENISIPLATYESPLWPSVGRGAAISRLTNGIKTTVVDERMSRSILLKCDDTKTTNTFKHQVYENLPILQEITEKTSSYAKLIDINTQIIGNLIFIRFEFTTGDAAGHNMVTNACDQFIVFFLKMYPNIKYSSISGNYCCDKKVSAVNGILGRGKNVVSETLIPKDICDSKLRTTARKIVELNTQKNLIGSIISGGIRTANAHFANMLLAFYLATGQDAANIVEGSQGIVHTEDRDGDLYFSCSLPNITVGTVGNGKGLEFVEKNLVQLGCREKRPDGENSRRLACLCAATVLCGELSLLAAQTNIGELMSTHIKMER